jgi:hypothetical protein
MPILTEETLSMNLPRMIKARQKFDTTRIENIEKAVRQELEQPKIQKLIAAGQSVAVAVGSRGINNLSAAVKVTVDYLRERGAAPFIVPAMGSHGGATAVGQAEVLQRYGITADTMGVPVRSAMEVDLIGRTPDGVPVYMDKNAHAADLVIPINRVKPHTSMRGAIESGLLKMCVIGLGKHVGCSRLHEEGWEKMSQAVVAAAEVLLSRTHIGFGLALVENAYDQTAIVKALVKDEIIHQESKLLARAKAMLPKLMLPDIDVLVVEQIGKDISGAGLDPNIVGRSAIVGRIAGYTGPAIKRIVVLDLSEATHGNACGLGNADFTTRKVFEKLDFPATFANAIAAMGPGTGSIPVFLDTEREAILAAVKCCGRLSPDGPRIVRIQDTLHLSEIWISENMVPFVASNDGIEIAG